MLNRLNSKMPEFDRKVLEVLREHLESGHITISRMARQADFPASFQLLVAMNPRPCGYLWHLTINAVARMIMCCDTMQDFWLVTR